MFPEARETTINANLEIALNGVVDCGCGQVEPRHQVVDSDVVDGWLEVGLFSVHH